MIEQLTKEQEAAIPAHVEKALKPLLTGVPTNKEQATTAIQRLYEFCGLKKPMVIFVSSPIAAQLAAYLLKTSGSIACQQVDSQVGGQVRDQVGRQVGDQVGSQVRRQVGSQVRDQVDSQVWSQVDSQVWGQVWDQVERQVWSQVDSQVWGQVWDQVERQVRSQVWGQVESQVCDQVESQVSGQVGSQVRDQVRSQVCDQVESQVRSQVGDNFEYEPFSIYGSYCADAYWLSFYRFFHEHDLVKLSNTQFHNLVMLCDSNVYDSIQLKGACICCEMPTRLERDEERRLHSTTGHAIEWSDGWGFHALWGVRFPAELWASVVNKTIAPADVLRLDNIEQRMAAMRFLGLDYIFEALPTKVLHKSSRGNTLFSIDGLTDGTEYALRYLCPSTKRQYVSFVPPDIGSEKDADLAMAWKHNMTKEMYQMMELES
jgi:hypothetical protein